MSDYANRTYSGLNNVTVGTKVITGVCAGHLTCRLDLFNRQAYAGQAHIKLNWQK